MLGGAAGLAAAAARGLPHSAARPSYAIWAGLPMFTTLPCTIACVLRELLSQQGLDATTQIGSRSCSQLSCSSSTSGLVNTSMLPKVDHIQAWRRPRTLVYACMAVSLSAHRRAQSERGTGTSLWSWY